MTKHILLLPFTALLASSAYCQQVNPAKIKALFGHPEHSKTLKACLNSSRNQQHKITGTAERIKTVSVYVDASGSGNMDLNDSSWFKYSGQHGSKFDYNDFEFTSNGPNPNVACDSFIEYADQGQGNGMELNSGLSSVYLAANSGKRSELVELVPGSSGQLDKNQGHWYKFDGAGNNTITYDGYWNSSNSWDTATRTEYAYNSQNKVTADSQYNYFSTSWSQKGLYAYDGNGNLLSHLVLDWSGSSWDSSSRTINTYNTNNKLVTSISQNYLSTTQTWENTNRDSFGYNNTDFYTFSMNQSWDNILNQWVNSSRDRKTLNSLNLPDTAYNDFWDDQTMEWQTQVAIKWHYNSNNNPLTANVFVSFGGFSLEVAALSLVYEPIDPSGVKTLPVVSNATIYPNPATDQVSIKWSNKTNGNIKMSLVNSIGQVVFATEQAAKDINIVSLAGLPSGSYMLIANDASGNTICNRQFIKQ